MLRFLFSLFHLVVCLVFKFTFFSFLFMSNQTDSVVHTVSLSHTHTNTLFPTGEPEYIYCILMASVTSLKFMVTCNVE